MITPKKTIVASKTLLKAYVAMKTGNKRKGARLFANLCADENMDVIMDGIGKSVQDLEAQEEEELFLDEGEEEDEFGLEDDEGLESEIDEELLIEDEEDDEEEGVEIPQTVASVLNLNYEFFN